MLTSGPRSSISSKVEINNIFTALILNAVTLNCAYRMRLWTSYDSQNKQRLFFLNKSLDLCNAEALYFIWGKKLIFKILFMWILPMVNVKIKLVDRVQQDDAQTLFASLLISLLSPLTSAFFSTYLYQKDKRALLGNLYSRTFISSPVKCSLSHYRPPLPLSHSCSHCSLFKVLKQIFASAAGNLLITFRNLALFFSFVVYWVLCDSWSFHGDWLQWSLHRMQRQCPKRRTIWSFSHGWSPEKTQWPIMHFPKRMWWTVFRELTAAMYEYIQDVPCGDRD
jgi:hypothetical protein